MELTQRQLLTIAHLKSQGVTSREDILAWANSKLLQPNYRQRIRRGHTGKDTRKHSRQYYQEIFNYYQSAGAGRVSAI